MHTDPLPQKGLSNRTPNNPIHHHRLAVIKTDYSVGSREHDIFNVEGHAIEYPASLAGRPIYCRTKLLRLHGHIVPPELIPVDMGTLHSSREFSGKS